MSFVNDDNITVTIADNIGESWEYGLALTGAFKMTKWWRLTGFASVYNKIIYSDDSFASLNGEKQEKASFQVNANSIMTFFKTYNFMMMMNYHSPQISYQRTTSRDLLFIVGLKKSLFKNGKLMIFYLPPYTKEFTFNKTVTESSDLNDEWKGVIKADYLFNIQFTYRFNSGKKVKKLNRSTDYDSDDGNSIF